MKQNHYLSEENLIGMGPIEIGSVEKCDAGIDGMVDELDHINLRLGRAVGGGHAHTP